MTQVAPPECCPPAGHGGPHTGVGRCALKEGAPIGKPMLKQASGRKYGPWRGAHTGASFLAGPVTPWGTDIGTVHS